MSVGQAYWQQQRRTVQYDTIVCFVSDIVHTHTHTHGWRRGVVVSGVRRMNEVNARRARLVPGSVTVYGQVYHLGI